MDENAEPGLSDQYRRASAWPVFVALGLVVSEVGVLFGFYPVAVGGLLLFVGSIAGIVTEAGYVARPWKLLAGLGVALVLGGLWVVWTQVGLALDAFAGALDSTNGVVVRGFAIAGAGIVAAVAGIAGWGIERAPGARNQ